MHAGLRPDPDPGITRNPLGLIIAPVVTELRVHRDPAVRDHAEVQILAVAVDPADGASIPVQLDAPKVDVRCHQGLKMRRGVGSPWLLV